ncbi:hypothetical protein [Actinophytocola gossypii]|uniref:WXG100 family type VII secretion target n=1 Tax=Actinophytocola gossypii TaxID=2812003 RepID=A0ABT2J437_9PSEU|nr:hypothetical protein [Actinophytocola gossypii]MCT2582621.1 hypothetical protein [Actinophytocola gossypii]
MYIDPNAAPPEEQTTRPSDASLGGVVGAGMRDLIKAVTIGNLRVDPVTGAATIDAIRSVRDQVDILRRLAQADGNGLGGGYARQVEAFNKEWALEGTEVLDRFSEQLDRLGEAVAQSMSTYLAADESGAAHVASVRPDSAE